ncbi:MAG: hypothetical protein Q8O54_08810 [Brevundimonas sp.]|nr:hypothetical protein [Brevundimonas sp.]
MGIVFGLIVTLGVASAGAEDWAIMASSRDFTTAVDLSSVAGPPSATRGWTLRVYRPRQEPTGIDYALIQREFDCQKGTTRIIASVGYQDDGTVVASSRTPGSADSVVPSSMAAVEMRAVCEGISDEVRVGDVPAALSLIRLLQEHGDTEN